MNVYCDSKIYDQRYSASQMNSLKLIRTVLLSICHRVVRKIDRRIKSELKKTEKMPKHSKALQVNKVLGDLKERSEVMYMILVIYGITWKDGSIPNKLDDKVIISLY